MRQGGHVFRLPNAVDRMALGRSFYLFRRIKQRLSERGLRKGRRNHVDPDLLGRQFGSQRFAQTFHSGFGCGNGTMESHTGFYRYRAEQNHTGPSGAFEPGQAVLDKPNSADHVLPEIRDKILLG